LNCCLTLGQPARDRDSIILPPHSVIKLMALKLDDLIYRFFIKDDAGVRARQGNLILRLWVKGASMEG
jgi:hypothetical protein